MSVAARTAAGVADAMAVAAVAGGMAVVVVTGAASISATAAAGAIISNEENSSRGATTGQVMQIYIIEGLFVLLLAVLAGPPLAAGV